MTTPEKERSPQHATNCRLSSSRKCLYERLPCTPLTEFQRGEVTCCQPHTGQTKPPEGREHIQDAFTPTPTLTRPCQPAPSPPTTVLIPSPPLSYLNITPRLPRATSSSVHTSLNLLISPRKLAVHPRLSPSGPMSS